MIPTISPASIEAWAAYREALAAHERCGTPASLAMARFAGQRWQRAYLGNDTVDDSQRLIVIPGHRP